MNTLFGASVLSNLNENFTLPRRSCSRRKEAGKGMVESGGAEGFTSHFIASGKYVLNKEIGNSIVVPLMTLCNADGLVGANVGLGAVGIVEGTRDVGSNALGVGFASTIDTIEFPVAAFGTAAVTCLRLKTALNNLNIIFYWLIRHAPVRVVQASKRNFHTTTPPWQETS
ncbi:MAG: hypothetical protein EXS31_06015 [Pedosphaera sp.]|nr:hypothetical protein [Pedosphaera sp.]